MSLDLRDPWGFPCQLPAVCRGATDVDGIRPVGIDQTNQTNTTWIKLAVPQPLARELANRWIGNVGYADFPETYAIELLKGSEVWRSLNPEVVRRLVPDLVPPEPEQPQPEPEPGSWLAYRREVAIRRASWLLKRERVMAELKRDPARTDVMISLELGITRTTIRGLRRKLEMAGAIPRVRSDRRATRPRPKFYKKRKAPQ